VALKQQRHDPGKGGQFAHRTRPLHVAGPAGVRERMRTAMEVLFPGSTEVQRRFEVKFHELADRQPFQFDVDVDVERAGLVVTPYEVVHASGAAALALRVGWQGHTIACTGDAEWTEVLVEVAQGADLLIAEGYTYRRGIRFHLDVATLRQQAGRFGGTPHRPHPHVPRPAVAPGLRSAGRQP
jgi:hypothetical protein